MSCSLMRRGVILRVTSSEPLLDQLAEHHSYDPEETEFESNTLDSLSVSLSLLHVYSLSGK